MSHAHGPSGTEGDDGGMPERKPRTIWLAGDETRKALADVADERIRQHLKWGVQRHDFPIWLTVLMEEVGELCEAVLRRREWDAGMEGRRQDIDVAGRLHRLRQMRAEAVQVAAVAVAMIEHIDEVLDA